MQYPIYSKKKDPILSFIDTFEFTKNLDVALRTVSIKMLKETFKKSNLLNHPEAEDFLIQGSTIFKTFSSLEKRTQLPNVEDRNTKCSACSLGKNVRAYDVKFKKQESNIFVVYNLSFAVNLEIINGELVNYSWCNFFLNKEEMIELLEFK